MPNVEQILADLVKGASRANGGVELQQHGNEFKLGNALGSMAGVVAGQPFGAGLIGAPLGGALSADEGRAGRGALGALLGSLGGGMAGTALGSAIHAPQLGQALGVLGGAGLGGHLGGKAPEPQSLADTLRSKLSTAYATGAQAAAARYKVAFAPLVAAGLSALAPAVARGAVSRFAPKALGAISKPIAGAVFDAGTQMATQKALSPRQ